ncbi:Glycerol-3-phosphate dehydrogenase [NAD(+)] [Mycena indigotica]|uniref:Glycerol-3-phosphate dehydrogenase [NAD(+)] n=1 Tax=Mycena indigotica TaxID=2126181 RepID=A0A8H6SXK2_9AGAR|nr:Glycerol-3-phosphate dehydrogenase [NAD(+)] [Mycena indigotica]KAF7307133.1 Glycerol-3-phosphate dehydrogenase [NAD(+)] [Mycena indigotica]
MVSALWKACSQGDLDVVNAELAAENVDLEIKDHTGSTPLIEAIKNGHAEIVKVLLDKGADPTNASSQGLPETFTSDQGILGMLNFARSKHSQESATSQTNGYEGNNASAYAPPANYPFFASLNGVPPPDMYYPPPMANGPRHNNLPPPEVASAIPCRYFPACRYGAACLFRHPQAPYYQAPPAPYPNSYEHVPPPQPYAPTYYPVSPPSFPPQQGPPMPMPVHGPPTSEMMPPPPPGHFSPTGAPAMPYGPISPIMYSHGSLPMPIPSMPTSQSPPSFNPASPSAAPNGFPNGHVAPYSPVNGAVYPDAAVAPQPNSQADAPRQDGSMGNRRGTGRRGSFARSKQTPPCIFFPTGRCKNGDECRFPHIMPPEGVAPPTSFPTRGGGPRPRGQSNGNGYAGLDEKMANMSLNGHSGPNSRGRGGKPSANGHKRAVFPLKQRVPNADEFPVLNGTTTPPLRVNGNGPTAAQILQAPRPIRTNGSQAATPRNSSPDRLQEPNGTVEPAPLTFASVATPDVAVSA